jgi:hypothetical protein
MLAVTVVFRTPNAMTWEFVCTMPEYFVAPQMLEVCWDALQDIAEHMFEHTSEKDADDALIELRRIDATKPGQFTVKVRNGYCTVYVFHNKLA